MPNKTKCFGGNALHGSYILSKKQEPYVCEPKTLRTLREGRPKGPVGDLAVIKLL